MRQESIIVEVPADMVDWLVILFYGELTLFESFNVELSHFDKFQTIQFRISTFFVYTQLNVKTVLFQIVQFRLNVIKWPRISFYAFGFS